MRRRADGPRRRRRLRGFTLVEMMLASTLMVLVALLLGGAWAAFGRPAISAVARTRMTTEVNLAAESLARDVGMLAQPGATGDDARYQNVQADGSNLYLAFDDGTGSPRTVRYSLGKDDPSTLLRIDGDDVRVVARHVHAFGAEAATLPLGPGSADVSGVKIELTLRHRVYDRDRDGRPRADHTRRYTLFVPDPLTP